MKAIIFFLALSILAGCSTIPKTNIPPPAPAETQAEEYLQNDMRGLSTVGVIGVALSTVLIFLTSSTIATYIGIGFLVLLLLSVAITIFAKQFALISFILLILTTLIGIAYLAYHLWNIVFVDPHEATGSSLSSSKQESDPNPDLPSESNTEDPAAS